MVMLSTCLLIEMSPRCLIIPPPNHPRANTNQRKVSVRRTASGIEPEYTCVNIEVNEIGIDTHLE